VHGVERKLAIVQRLLQGVVQRAERIENFLSLQLRQVDSGTNTGTLLVGGKFQCAPRFVQQLTVRPSKRLRQKFRGE
jgi:hypothetical protein